MRVLALSLSAAFVFAASATVRAETGSGGVNDPSQRDKPYLILVSIDGLGLPALERAETPAIDRLAAGGTGAKALVPVFPTLTFPNHFSIATGLYPAEHGIVGNRFPDENRQGWYALYDRNAVQDGRWYAGEPIWVRAEKHGMVAAAYYFVGTEAAVGGIRPSYYFLYDKNTPGLERVGQVLDWLRLPAERRPHVITLYFEDVDTASHSFGVRAPETTAAVERVDAYIGELLAGIESLPVAARVNIVIVSDHGAAEYDRSAPPLVLDHHIDLAGIHVVAGGSYAMLYFDRPDPARAEQIVALLNDSWDGGRAFVRSSAPAAWRVADDNRFADVIVQPDLGHAVVATAAALDALDAGDHGWAPEEPAMHGIFIASGPDVPGYAAQRVDGVVDVLPLMLRILGLPGSAEAPMRARKGAAPPAVPHRGENR